MLILLNYLSGYQFLMHNMNLCSISNEMFFLLKTLLHLLMSFFKKLKLYNRIYFPSSLQSEAIAKRYFANSFYLFFPH